MPWCIVFEVCVCWGICPGVRHAMEAVYVHFLSPRLLRGPLSCYGHTYALPFQPLYLCMSCAILQH